MEDKDTIEKPKTSKMKMFMFGYATAAVMAVALTIWIAYQNDLKAEAYAKNRAVHESERLDSIAKADKVIKRYWSMVKYLNRQDSIFSSLKYKIGDIVYLKPDSTRGVVENVIGDEKMDCFTYFILRKSKDGGDEVVQKNIKLIY